MKKILTSSITDSAQLPILKRTIDHIQEMEMENIKSAIYASLGSSNDSVPIVLWGCVGTLSTVDVSNDTLTVTAGAFIYNGEIYQISAQIITKTGANVFTLSLDTTTFQAGEPTIYSDGATSVNTNQNLKIKLSQGLTGTGICDWDNRNFYRQSVRDVTINGTGDISSSAPTTTNCTVTSINVAADKVGSTITIKGALSCTITSNSAQIITLNLKSKFNKLTNYVEYYPVTGVRYSGSSITPEVTEVFTGLQNTGTLRIAFTYTNGDALNLKFSFSYQAY